MRTVVVLAASSLMLLAACEGGDLQNSASEEGDASAPTIDMAIEGAASGPTPGGDEHGASSPEVPDAQVSQLAYAYATTIEAPAARIAGLAARHEQACVQAGPRRCQVIGSSTRSLGEDERSATLEIRAEPGWLAGFRQRLAADAEAADGRVADSSTTSEDLTRALIDTEAHLRAKTALRDRLQTMLATRDGNLQTVLEVERELARVQGEIDAATSTLEVMRARVAMSRLTLTYRSEGVLAPDSATAPLSAALENALSLFMMGLAAIVSVLAFALPFVLVIGPVVWLVLRWRARRRAERLAVRRTLADAPSEAASTD